MPTWEMVIIDNALSNFDDLKKLVTELDSTWTFLQNTTDPSLVDVDQGFQRRIPVSMARKIVHQVKEATGLPMGKVDMSRANCKFPTNRKSTKHFHVDQTVPHWVILAYITANKAPTRLTDIYWTPGIKPIQDNLTVTEAVYPEPNRVLVFDGLRFHADSTPLDHARINVNINVYPT